MMALETIIAMNDEKTSNARKFHEIPYTIWPGDVDNWRNGKRLPIPFPHIGNHEPSGFELDGDPWMVDTSGFGLPGEPALTQDQLFDKLETGKAYAFVEVGQFQAYIQQFTKRGASHEIRI